MKHERITAAQAQALYGKRGGKSADKPKRRKYGNEPTVVDGITFDSKKEADRYGELKLLERAGLITELELQPKIILIGANGTPLLGRDGRPLFYKGDFGYLENGVRVIEDVKSEITKENRVYLLKKAILAAQGIEIREV